MESIQKYATDVLKIHPRNQEFFDDISGDEYERFKQSIANDGVISPIIISPDMTVVSGHQRLKACKDLGIKLIPAIMREELIDEDEKLKILLAANFGRTKNNEAKQRKIAVEYVNLCGLKDGQHTKVVDNRLPLKEIAAQLGTSETSLKELLLIERKLTPDIKELIDGGSISKTTAAKILTKLSPDEQSELISTYGAEIIKGATQAQVQQYIDDLKAQKDKVSELEIQVKAAKTLLSQAERERDELKNRPVEVVDKTDYATIDSLRDRVAALEKEKTSLEKKVSLNADEASKYSKLKSDIEYLTRQKNDIAAKIDTVTELSALTVEMKNLLENKLAPIKYKRCIEVLDSEEIALDNLEDIILNVEKWVYEIKGYLPGNKRKDNVVWVQS